MRLIALTDIHDNALSINRIGRQLMEADLVLVAGDITTFGNKKDAQRIIETLYNYNQNILAVPGNCDPPDVGLYLRELNISLDKVMREINGYYFWGLGGSLPAPGGTPNELTEQQFENILNSLSKQIKEPQNLILLIHQPPFNTRADGLYGNEHVGSFALRRFVEQVQPLAYFTGHIHEGKGIDFIGKTVIVNPGPLRNGGFASAKLEGHSIKVEIKTWSY